MRRVLCLAAHPDDLEVYMGGALLGMCRIGIEVRVWIATRGESGTLQPAHGSRVDEASAALGSLGIPFRVGGLADGGLAEAQDLDSILDDLVREEDFDLVFAPHPADPHPDHAVLGASSARLGLAKRCMLWHWLDASSVVEPSHFLDLGSSLAEKLALIGYHKSQIPGPEGPRDHLPAGRDLLQRAEHRDRGYGVSLGRAYLEPYLTSEPGRNEAACILESVRDFFDHGRKESGGSS